MTVTVPDVRVRFRWGTLSSERYDAETCSAIDIQYGRSSPLEEQFPAGVCQLTLDDSGGVFDPDNTGSPLHGHLSPQSGTTTVEVQIFQTENSEWHSVFNGRLQSVSRSWPGGATFSVTTVRALDGASELSEHVIRAGTVYASQLPGARIAALYAAASRSGQTYATRVSAGWPETSIANGSRMLGTLMADGKTSTWAYISQAAFSDTGIVYFNKQGTLQFVGGQQLEAVTAPVWTLGDTDATVRLEDDLTYTLADEGITSDVAYSTVPVFTRDTLTGDINTSGGSTGIAGPTSADVDDGVSGVATQLADMHQVKSLAVRAYTAYSTARREIETVTIDGMRDYPDMVPMTSTYRFALLADVGQRVRVVRTPPGGGTQLDHEFFIEAFSMSMRASPAEWKATVRLSPAVTYATRWRLGVSGLNDDTRLSW